MMIRSMSFVCVCVCARRGYSGSYSEDVEIGVEAARKALARNKGKDWASAPGAVRAKYLRAIAAKVVCFSHYLALSWFCSCMDLLCFATVVYVFLV